MLMRELYLREDIFGKQESSSIESIFKSVKFLFLHAIIASASVIWTNEFCSFHDTDK